MLFNSPIIDTRTLTTRKALRETQTLRVGCNKNFRTPQTPSRGRGTGKI